MPDNAPLTYFSQNEIIRKTTAPGVKDFLSIKVPPFLHERRIYAYLETIGGGGFYGRLFLFRGKSPVGDYPLEIGVPVVATENRSTVSILNYGGTPVGDCLVLNFLNPFTATVNVTIQPLRVNLEIDELYYETQQIVGSPTGWRVFIGCLSTRVQ